MKTTRAGALSMCVQCGGTWQGDRCLCDCPAYVVVYGEGSYTMAATTMSVPQLCETLFPSPTVPVSTNGVTPAMMREGLAEVSTMNRQQRRRAAKEAR